MFEHRAARLGHAFGVSLAAHGLTALLVLLVIGSAPALPESTSNLRAAPPAGIVWIATPGKGKGGGGNGNEGAGPPRAARVPGLDQVALAVAAPPAVEPRAAPPAPVPVIIPAVSTRAGVEELPGAVTSPFPHADSLGSGTGGGAGAGRGGGIGDGDGSGLGDGFGGGTGGDAYEPGGSVTSPQLIRETKPNYTEAAMQAKVQGAVWLEAIVLPDGSVGAVQVTRSLDPRFGLDQEAIRTIKQWRFLPGRMRGKPVPVRVAIEMAFTLR